MTKTKFYFGKHYCLTDKNQSAHTQPNPFNTHYSWTPWHTFLYIHASSQIKTFLLYFILFIFIPSWKILQFFFSLPFFVIELTLYCKSIVFLHSLLSLLFSPTSFIQRNWHLSFLALFLVWLFHGLNLWWMVFSGSNTLNNCHSEMLSNFLIYTYETYYSWQTVGKKIKQWKKWREKKNGKDVFCA